MLDKAFHEKMIKFHPLCSNIGLTHLSFADDLILFSDASPQSLAGIKDVLLEFYSLFGLQVNYHKSELYCCNVSSSDQAVLASLLGMRLGKLPVRYLGVPLISWKFKDSYCQPLIEKITARIFNWISKYLTFADRLQLIDSVINSMIHYCKTVFILPKKIIKAVEIICSSYLWSRGCHSAKSAKVSWKIVFPLDLKEGWASKISLFRI